MSIVSHLEKSDREISGAGDREISGAALWIITVCKCFNHQYWPHTSSLTKIQRGYASHPLRSVTYNFSWWRHQMEPFSALLDLCAGNSPVSGEFPAQRPVGRSFDVFFDLRVNKRLSKQSWGWWFETLSRSFWRHHNGIRNHLFEEIYSTCNWQQDAYSFYCT